MVRESATLEAGEPEAGSGTIEVDDGAGAVPVVVAVPSAGAGLVLRIYILGLFNVTYIVTVGTGKQLVAIYSGHLVQTSLKFDVRN